MCSTCDKKFVWKEALQNHQATHSNERPHACNICPDNRSYKTKYDLKQHMIRHYKPKFSCGKCGKKFYTRGNMKQHENRNIC